MQSLLLSLVLLPLTTLGFSVGGSPCWIRLLGKHSSSLSSFSRTQLTAVSRRDLLENMATTAVVVGTCSATITTSSTAAKAASAEIDYSRIQDLLGDTTSSSAIYNPSGVTTTSSLKRPTYLTEPTDEFKQNEAKASEFKRLNLQQKQIFTEIMTRFDMAPTNDETALTSSLDDMRRFVRKANGLPQGITKQDVITIVRRRKAKKDWPTNAEIAYQDLLLEIQYQQSPNTQKNEDNPM